MKVKEMIERLSNCDPEAEVLMPNSDAEEVNYHRITGLDVQCYEECKECKHPHLVVHLKYDPDREIEPGALPCVLLEREY